MAIQTQLFARYILRLTTTEQGTGSGVDRKAKRRGGLYGDRFHPIRSGNRWGLWTSSSGKQEEGPDSQNTDPRAKGIQPLYNSVLENEVLGPGGHQTLFHTTPLSQATRNLLFESAIRERTETRIPYNSLLVLDAPNMVDNFYYNLLDWSGRNMVAVGLGPNVFIQEAFTKEETSVLRLSGIQNQGVTGCKWNEQGNLLAVGSMNGTVLIYDLNRSDVPLRTLHTPTEGRPVGAMAWKGPSLLAGTWDGSVLQADLRCDQKEAKHFKAHGNTVQICSIKYSPDQEYFATSGNAYEVKIWTPGYHNPVGTMRGHSASIKAMDWSPHEYGLLATGGGVGDYSLHFHNVLTGDQKLQLNTEAQVCNLAWSPRQSQLVSTHGFLEGAFQPGGSQGRICQNSIKVWSYPSMELIGDLEGHEASRTQYMSKSPDGEFIVTGGSDETIRFWRVFPAKPKVRLDHKSVLDRFSRIR